MEKNYAFSFQKDIKLETKNFQKLLKLLGNPHEGMKYIHVGGTNGKGSVCSYLESMLIYEGKTVGKFSSPELFKKNELIRYCGNDISDEELVEPVNFVTKKAETMEICPSPFEIICGGMFLYFKEKKCDYVILEVGMGGSGDATNVILENELCVLTHIDMDHTAFLGNTIEKITKAKCGIIKENSRVVTLLNNGDIGAIKNKCKETNSLLHEVKPFETDKFCGTNEIIKYNNKEIKLSLSGINQLENSALAVKCAELLGISSENIKRGLENTFIKARFEEILKGVYFDGAHNKNGIRAMKQSILRYFGNNKTAFLMGVMADKDFDGMLEEIKEITNELYFVTVENNPRALNKEEMQKIAQSKGFLCKTYDNINEAILNINTRPMFVCGSLYMYKDINFPVEMNENGI